MNQRTPAVRCLCLLPWFTLLVSGHAQGPMDILKLSVAESGQTIHYGSDRLQFGELRLPKSKSLSPIVLLIHGGCWSDPLQGFDSRATTLELMKPLAAALTSAGVATWNVEYRRRGSPGSSWANTYLDLAAATDYLRKLAPGNHLDLSRIVVVGHPAGGQLALWLGARSKLSSTSKIYTKDPLHLNHFIDFDGPPDLAAAQPFETEYCPIQAVSLFMEGTSATQPQRYHDGSGQSFLPLGIPQTLVVASVLEIQPDLVASYQAAAKAKGEAISVVSLKAASHFAPPRLEQHIWQDASCHHTERRRHPEIGEVDVNDHQLLKRNHNEFASVS